MQNEYNKISAIDVIDAIEVPSKRKNSSKEKTSSRSNYFYTIEIDEPEVFINDSFLGRHVSSAANSHFKFKHPEDND
jgi:hypothetical protein